MNTRKNVGTRVGKATARGNKDTPQAPAAGVKVLVSPAVLTDGEARASLVQLAQAIIAEAKVITTHDTREGASKENPHASTMASRLRDFTTMNPPVYFGSKTN
ncbi:hypothetical protein EJD97_001111, partial [Solanum chilense]